MSLDNMPRSDYVAWCKRHALVETEPADMLASFVSDVSKHPETSDLAGFATLAGSIHATDPDGMRDFIKGFA